MFGKSKIQEIADRVVADSYDTATGEPVNRASVLMHSHVTAWPEARGMDKDERANLIDQVAAAVSQA